MDPNIEALALTLKDLVVGRAKALLDQQKAARKEFLEERMRRLAELTVEVAKAPTQADRDAMLAGMETVGDTIINELVAAAVDTSVATRQTFQTIIATVIDFAWKALPKVIPALGGLI